MSQSHPCFLPSEAGMDNNTQTRVEELWFSDGGLIVQAEQSLFRVSGGILAARSPVFKDMLSFIQPPDAEKIDGCPVVTLPDSAADVTCFFKAIFDSSFFEPYPSKVHLIDVFSILHLSNKYAVDYLLRRALVHLSSDFQTTLSGYDEMLQASYESSIIDGYELTAVIAALQIAREVNALWILPTVFYELAAVDEPALQRILEFVSYKDRPARLSNDDRIRFLKMSIHITRQATEAMRFLCHPDTVPGCTGGHSCINARMSAIARVQQDLSNSKRAYSDPLALCTDTEMWNILSDDCCPVCYKSLKSGHKATRQVLWDKLPEFCGLPPWAELEEMKARAIAA
ncbi:hypothetical protein B0H19DRAFT_716897 [Mycena capillaripes]|nr:hypothetical protein B0H19DRAFT_716897 [Mycena capillaripes]